VLKSKRKKSAERFANFRDNLQRFDFEAEMMKTELKHQIAANDMKNPVRVLVIENQTLVKIGIRTVLSAREDFEIVGEAETGAEGLSLFQALQPDVTILSLRLPDSCAIDTLGDYFAAEKRARILVLADTAGDAEISKALKKGALGYICKDISPDELVKALRTVAAGKKYIPSDIAGILSESFGSEELTATESRILQQIVAGKSNKEIAYDLNISENTVKTHVKNIFEKLGVSDRTSAATLAIRRGLVRIHL
jgi:DNA-binding NarL/FixJ family response regulator